MEWKNYRYFDPKSIGLDFQGMTDDLNSAPDGSVVVLHGQSTFPQPARTAEADRLTWLPGFEGCRESFKMLLCRLCMT